MKAITRRRVQEGSLQQAKISGTYPEWEREVAVGAPRFFREMFLGEKARKRSSPLSDRGIECDVGWRDILVRLAATLEPMGVYATQVKSKFAYLTVYLGGNQPPEVAAIMDAAVKESTKVCEKCGAPGRRYERTKRGPWMVAVCRLHLRLFEEHGWRMAPFPEDG